MKAERSLAARLEADLGGLLDDLSSDSITPAASSVAALSVCLAATLVAKSARRSAPAMESAAALAAQADSLGRRALALVSINAEAYERAVAALPAGAADQLRAPGAASPTRDLEIQEALAGTNDALAGLIQVACDVCLLAALVAEQGEPDVRGDAAVAATQAEAGVRAAAYLIEIGLLSGGAEDLRAAAHDALAAAAAASERARATGR